MNFARFGAVADGKNADHMSMQSGSTLLMSDQPVFSPLDVGKTVELKRAGAGGAALLTTITSYASAYGVQLNQPAAQAVSGQRAMWGTDNTAALRQAASKAARKQLVIPEGSYLIVASSGITIPSNTEIIGTNASSVFLLAGTEGLSEGGVRCDPSSCIGLIVADGSQNVWIHGLHFIGGNAPFEFVWQNESAAIAAHGISGATKMPRNIVISDCVFDDLYGFSVHNAGLGDNIHVFRNTMRNNANGVNVNSDHSIQALNRLINTESIEASGAYTLIADNIFEPALLIGISAGGGAPADGSVVFRNTIHGATFGYGIVAADNWSNGAILQNTIDRTQDEGILVAGSPNSNQNVLLLGNTITNPGQGGYPAAIYDASGTNTWIVNNEAFSLGADSTPQKFGLLKRNDGAIVRGNHFAGTLCDVMLIDSGVVQLSSNVLATPSVCTSGNTTVTQ